MFLDDLGDLVSSGLPGTVSLGTNLFLGSMPALAQDRAILISETGGLGPIHTMAPSVGSCQIVQRPRAQVWCRGAVEGYQGARQDAENVFRVLNGVRDRTINGTHYLWITAVQDPFALPPDENLRPAVAFNLDVLRSPSTSTST